MSAQSFRALCLATAGACALLAGGLAHAQAAPQTFGPASFEAHDRNGDGFISRAELDAIRATRRSAAVDSGRPMRGAAMAPGFEQLDTDGDGRISRDEFNTAPRSGMGGGRGMGGGMGRGTGSGGMGPGMGGGTGGMQGMGRNMPGFAAYDANGDGFISATEFDAARTARIAERSQQGYPMRNLKDVRFADIDSNGDGRVDASEFTAHQRAARNAR